MSEQVRAAITEDDLMLPEREWFEVVDGEWVEIDTDMMGLLHTVVIHNLYDLLHPFAQTHSLGFVHGDGLQYVLAVDERGVRTVRVPDLAFLRKGRITAEIDIQRPFRGAPDFIVEVVSPGQKIPDLLARVADYLKYGTEEAWVIYPIKREVHRYRRDEQGPEIYGSGDTLRSETLFPGLDVSVDALFVVEG